MYVSLGFLVSTARRNLGKLTSLAIDHKMTAVAIGRVDSGSSLKLKMGTEERLLFDFSKGPVLTPRVPPHWLSPS
jgi:selenophosphate synthetase-related protein